MYSAGTGGELRADGWAAAFAGGIGAYFTAPFHQPLYAVAVRGSENSTGNDGLFCAKGRAAAAGTRTASRTGAVSWSITGTGSRSGAAPGTRRRIRDDAVP